jgi:poly-gamma-glutamate synthesis protein (capsule biosynthesis protein)
MKTRTVLLCLIGILGIILSGCGSQPTPTPTATPLVLPTSIPTIQPTATTPAPSLWVAPYVPAELAQSVALPDGWGRSDTAEAATARLEIGDGNIVSRWVYALVAPFPTIIDDVSAQDIKNAWLGNLAPTFGSQLLVDQNTRDVFAAWWGEPSASTVKVLPADQLVTTAWDDMTSWAIVPFEQIEPRWKVISVDQASPLHKDFQITGYGLSIPFSLDGSGAVSMAASNRDPNKLTTVITTGTTALVRGTAFMMEEKGVLYPAQNIAPILQNADILHVSNEIPFYQGCPFPTFTDSLVFCSDPKYIELLKYIGTDVVELTGDHFANYGPDAMLYTIQMYKDLGWQYYGGGVNLQDGLKPATFTNNGNKIAFVGCNAKGAGYADASDTEPGAASCLNGGYDTIHQEIQQLKQEGYVVIATFQHQEYYQYTVLPQYRPDFTAMVDAGADIVSGSQAHQPQNMEFYKGSFIHYGTGNLFFDQYITPGGDQLPLDRAFIDRHVIYNGKYLNTELITIKFLDFALSREMTPAERADFLTTIFAAGGWEVKK